MRKHFLFIALAVFSLTAGCYDTSEEVASLIRFPVSDMAGLVTQTGVEIDGDITSDGNGSFSVTADGPVTVELYRLQDIDLDNTRVVYKAKLRTEDLTGSDDKKGIAYLEMKALFPDGEELVSRGPRIPPTGTTDWTLGETVLYLDKGGNPEQIKLNFVVDGKGRAWIDDIIIDHRPLRLDYLFWGHAVVWIILIIYIYHLLGKQRRLRKELESMKAGA